MTDPSHKRHEQKKSRENLPWAKKARVRAEEAKCLGLPSYIIGLLTRCREPTHPWIRDLKNEN